MHQTLFAGRRVAALTALALTLFAGACKDSTGVEEEPEVATMRLTITGGAVATVNAAGQVTGTLTLTAGAPATITGEFLNAQGQPDDHVTPDEFQLFVNPAAGITFTRTGPFTGTLSAANAGAVAVQFGLLHVPENHNDFGPFTVNVTVNAP